MSHILAFFILFCDRKKGGERVQNRIYLRPELYDLSQGTRIKFVRIFRHLTQDNISDDLGTNDETINLFFDEWNNMRDKKQKMIINYEEYFEWKINYKVKEDSNE